jgi:hypothetical protein
MPKPRVHIAYSDPEWGPFFDSRIQTVLMTRHKAPAGSQLMDARVLNPDGSNSPKFEPEVYSAFLLAWPLICLKVCQESFGNRCPLAWFGLAYKIDKTFTIELADAVNCYFIKPHTDTIDSHLSTQSHELLRWGVPSIASSLPGWKDAAEKLAKHHDLREKYPSLSRDGHNLLRAHLANANRERRKTFQFWTPHFKALGDLGVSCWPNRYSDRDNKAIATLLAAPPFIIEGWHPADASKPTTTQKAPSPNPLPPELMKSLKKRARENHQMVAQYEARLAKLKGK